MVESLDLDGKKITIETGRLAKQASGSALVTIGKTKVLVTTCVNKNIKEGTDFLPLTVNYVEKFYSAGKIPGGFFKREGRATEKEVLTSRFLDRPIRPLFPENYFFDTQVIATVISMDEENDPDMAAMLGVSFSLMSSEIPFNGPTAGVRVGRINGEFIINPTYQEIEKSDTHLVIAGSIDAITMVEGSFDELDEEDILSAINFGHSKIIELVSFQNSILEKLDTKKMEIILPSMPEELVERIKENAYSELKKCVLITSKQERNEAISLLREKTNTLFSEIYPDNENLIYSVFEDIQKEILRNLILDEGKRIDGRGLKDIRPITCSIGEIPMAHGSAVFTRGETQALVVTTLGTKFDEQIIDAPEKESFKRFMIHYNFPPFSVGEVAPLRGPGRREIGHGSLGEKALRYVIPSKDEFPYTIRVVSEILESNGSSSQATICGAILSLMDAGVPIKSPIAGIAMGLIKENEKVAILTDILGDEDHLGDMDFKVAGTRNGVTALQMDIKIAGVTDDILRKALAQAKEGRIVILDIMLKTISEPKKELAPNAPQIITMKVKPDKVREIIGQGGKVIKGIIEKSGAKIDIDDTGKINIYSSDKNSLDIAVAIINDITQEAEIGKIYYGKVRKIMEFGAFVEIFPGTDGLVHISQLDEKRVENVLDILKEGDEVKVKVIDIDKAGKIKLSRKAAL
ncbi:MAG: polyribonucleotide nucleotidyltransferase [Candidatus Acididesulfobacter diazotrophicus]|uniref:Polyribonucleotide nucleotidyltransferase n=1 Tax=Candidatus Acididesulfobacter diazotrophicus TaxID=2597226 RepID=A0A519BNX2_9DELT|nr:MAG: polyribonucleotide nucleotidyltransferase [Candidatus Acididesulfobacter diazotrophicus]